MAWETINGRRYFYETTYSDGKRCRRCWGNGPEAEQAAARVQQAKQRQVQELVQIRALKVRDRELDHLTAQFNAQIKAVLDQYLHRAGFHYTRGQWRKFKRK